MTGVGRENFPCAFCVSKTFDKRQRLYSHLVVGHSRGRISVKQLRILLASRQKRTALAAVADIIDGQTGGAVPANMLCQSADVARQMLRRSPSFKEPDVHPPDHELGMTLFLRADAAALKLHRIGATYCSDEFIFLVDLGSAYEGSD